MPQQSNSMPVHYFLSKDRDRGKLRRCARAMFQVVSPKTPQENSCLNSCEDVTRESQSNNIATVTTLNVINLSKQPYFFRVEVTTIVDELIMCKLVTSLLDFIEGAAVPGKWQFFS